jgi:hypothetical protein
MMCHEGVTGGRFRAAPASARQDSVAAHLSAPEARHMIAQGASPGLDEKGALRTEGAREIRRGCQGGPRHPVSTGPSDRTVIQTLTQGWRPGLLVCRTSGANQRPKDFAP